MLQQHRLPVYTHRKKILSILKKNQVVVIESPTGSGKTTQLPIILYKDGYTRRGKLGITQPRRIAVLSVSHYIKQTISERNRGLVGYKMRFEDATTPATHIKVMTDGILLQEIKGDPLLSQYKTIIIDEAHERSLTIDFILGLLKRALTIRKDLKVLISSATINTKIFSRYFDNCPIISIPAKSHKVDTLFLDKTPQGTELIDVIVQKVKKFVHDPNHKDILVFLPGEAMIKQCQAAILAEPWRKIVIIRVLYARISSEQQELALEAPPPGYKKLVLATNMAETSITIDGVTAVIDTGLAKVNSYNPVKRTSTLEQTHISRSSAMQRKGRAGRTAPGTCLFLYAKQSLLQRPMYPLEEIMRTDLAEVVLRMADLGIDDFESFEFILAPKRTDLHGAVKNLIDLCALAKDHSLTSIGKMMLHYPLAPRHARIIVESINRYPDALTEILTIISFLTTSTPFLLPFGKELLSRTAHMHFAHDYGDFHALLHLYKSYMVSPDKDDFCKTYFLDQQILREIVNIRAQLVEISEELGAFISEKEAKYDEIMLCLSSGLASTLCFRNRRNYISKTTHDISIHPGCLLKHKNPDWIIASEIITTSRTFARSIGVLTDELAKIIDPKLYTTKKQLAKSNKDHKIQKKNPTRKKSPSTQRQRLKRKKHRR